MTWMVTAIISGYPDGNESMAAYLFYKFKQPGQTDFHYIAQCQSIIAEFRQSSWVFEDDWQRELNALFSNSGLTSKSFVCLLVLKLAACQYLNNPERLAYKLEYQEVFGMQQMYVGYLAKRTSLNVSDRLTIEEEKVLLQAMANKANEQLVRKRDLRQRPYLISQLVIERSRCLDNELYNQLRHWPFIMPELPDIFRDGCFPRFSILRRTWPKDKHWDHDLSLLPSHMLESQHTMDIIWGRKADKALPRPVGSGLAPDREGFLSNTLHYYDIARNRRHPERPQLKQFLDQIVVGDRYVQNLTLFLQLVLQKPSKFGPAELPAGSDLAPQPENYNLPANYDNQVVNYKRRDWRDSFERKFTRNYRDEDPYYPNARAYLRDCEYHEYRQKPLGRLSWYFYKAYGQNEEQLQARVELKEFDRSHLLSNQHRMRLPGIGKYRLNYTDTPPCELVEYQPLVWESREDDAIDSFQTALGNLHAQHGHLAQGCIALLTPIDPEEKAQQLQAKMDKAAELSGQIKAANDASDDDVSDDDDKTPNPCLKYPLDRLVKGLEIHESQIAQDKAKTSYRLGTTCTEINTSLPTLERHVKERAEQLRDQVEKLEKDLLAQLRDFDTLDTAICHRLKTFKPITILELASIVGKGRESQLAALHPEWDEVKRHQIFLQCIEYLLHSTELQHMERLLPQCAKMQALVTKIEEETGSDCLTDEAKLFQEQLVSLMVQDRAYCGDSADNQARLEFLLFEYIMNIRIRADQVESCKKLDEHIRVNAEIPTGSGKSTLILPYLCYKAYLDGKIPILVVPPELIEQQKGILKHGLCKMFDTDLSELHFERERARDPHYIDALLNRLKTDYRQKHIILCRMNELHSIICLQKKEILFQIAFSDRDKSILNSALIKLDELQCFIEDNCNFIIDESRTNFNPNHSYDYAVGEQVPQSDVTQAAMKHIFQVIHQHLKNEYILDFMGAMNTGQTIITADVYSETVSKKLAENLIPLFLTQSVNELSRNKKLLSCLVKIGQYFTAPLSPQDATNIKDILCKLMRQDLTMQHLEPADRSVLNAFLDSHRERPLYATVREVVGTKMGNTLCRKVDDSYGLNEESTRVVPYTNGVPKPTSEFGSPLVNTILTVQAFLFTPINRTMISHWTTKLRQLEQDLPLEEIQDHPQMQLFFKIVQQCKSLRAAIPSNLTTIDLDHICDYLNKPESFELKLEYICDVILPAMKMYQRKVTSSSFSIVSFCTRLKTASGTVEVNVLPKELMTLEAEQAPIPNLMQLLQGKWDKPALRIDATDDEKQRLLNIVRQCPNATVIIDAGDCFRSLSHHEIADCLHYEIYIKGSSSEMSKKDGILVFDHNGVAWVKKRIGGKLVLFENCGIAPDRVAIAMQKNKAEGTDWKMSLDAHGVVTVDRTTDLSLMIQAAGRMRQLQKGQSVELAYMSEQEALLLGADETEFESSKPEGDCTNGVLVSYLARVEGQRMMKQAVPLLSNFMRAKLEQVLYTDFPREIKFSEKSIVKLVKRTKEFLVPLTHTSSLDLLGSEQVTISLDEMADRVFNQFIPVINDARSVHSYLRTHLDQARLRREYDEFIAKIVLPNTFETLSGVISNAADLTSEVTVTQEKEQEVEVEVTPVAIPLELDYQIYEPVHWDGNFLDWTKHKTPEFRVGSTQVYFGPNTIQFAKASRFKPGKIEPMNKKYHKPIYHAMYFQCEGEAHDKLFLGDVEDMKRAKQYLDDHSTETVLQPPQDGSPQPGTSTQLVKTKRIWQLDGITDGCYIHEGSQIIMAFCNGRFAAAEDDDKRRIMLLLKLSANIDRLPSQADKEALRFWMEQSPEEGEKVKAYLERILKSNFKMNKAISYIYKD